MSNQPNDQELDGVIQRINRLGTASERMFSRLYKGLGRHDESSQQVVEQNRQLQSSLRQRNVEVERLNSILASIDQGVIMQDNEGRLVLVNESARKLLGNIKAFWESELGLLFNKFREVVAVDSELAPLHDPIRVQVNNRIIGAQMAAVGDEQGNRLGTIIVLRDVTSEALSERLKNHFITAISHELRTPMAVIKGVSELVANSDTMPNRRLLETLSRNVDVLDRMIVELLDISELNSENFSIRQEKLDLEELLWNVVSGLAPETLRAHLDVSVLVRNASDLFVRGDDQRLRWAFGHLLQNALRYTEAQGHILLTVTQSDPDHFSIQFVDTGVGIFERDLPHIFDQFYRGEARNPNGKLIDPRGLGQGLFIARRVIEAHGGYVSVSSQHGQGSIFTVVLPRYSETVPTLAH